MEGRWEGGGVEGVVLNIYLYRFWRARIDPDFFNQGVKGGGF